MATKGVEIKQSKSSKKVVSKALPCGCTKSPTGETQSAIYQDEKYGRGMRMHIGKTGKSESTCTICGKTKQQV